MNNKEFVAFLRLYLSDKEKLKKNEVFELKKLLNSVYNELPQDIAIREWTNAPYIDYTPYSIKYIYPYLRPGET